MLNYRKIWQAFMYQNWWHTGSSNESSGDVFNNIVDMFVRAGIHEIEQNIDRAQRIGKSYHHKKSKKSVRA